MLIGLGSKLIKAVTATGIDAQKDWRMGVDKLLDGLGLNAQKDLNPRGNRFMLTFLPGLDESGDFRSDRAGEIMDELRQRTHARLPMFGGVACGGLNYGQGTLFEGDNVYCGAAVAALVDCDIAYGITLALGLAETKEVLRVKSVSDDGHAITAFWDGDLKTVMGRLPSDCFFRERRDYGDFFVVQPSVLEDRVLLRRPVTERSVLHVMRPDPKGLSEVGSKAMNRLMQRARLRPGRITGLLGIGCVARYRLHKSSGFNIKSEVQRVRDLFPDAIFAGCYMGGEIGLDSLGRSVLGNQSVSLALFADDIRSRSEISIGFDVLASHAKLAGLAHSLDMAVQRILQSVQAAGYSGAMLSLVLQDGDARWIVARHALGEAWQKKVLPLTRRKLPGYDILALVAEQGVPRFVADSRRPDEQCDLKAVEQGAILSQYIIPLHNGKTQTLGLLQVDLGDMRDTAKLGEEQKTFLDALGDMAANLLARVIHTEELDISRQLDHVLVECLESDTHEQAAVRFIQAAALILRADGHVRLREPGTTQLRLVGGVGQYFDVAAKERVTIDLNDRSPSTNAVRLNKMVLCNDAENEEDAALMRERFKDGPLGEACRQIKSFANFPIGLTGDEARGMINFCSDEKWFFTQSKLRSIQNIGERLALLLDHIERKEVERRSRSEKDFLLDITPRMQERLDLHAALREQVDRIRRASNANVVSCFLWDEDLQRYILRAEEGWHDKRWLDAAWYEKGKGMTGSLATTFEPRYIPDLVEFKKQIHEGPGKYITEVFGRELTASETCEVIALPLNFRGRSLGIVTLFRRRLLTFSTQPPGFTTVIPAILKEAAEKFSAYVYALVEHENAQAVSIESQRLNEVDALLLVELPLRDKLSNAMTCIAKQYSAVCCSTYAIDRAQCPPVRERLAFAGALDGSVPCLQEGGLRALQQILYAQSSSILRRPVTPDQKNPEAVKLDKGVQRICIPIKFGKETLGVLDVCWNDRLPAAHVRLKPFEDLAERIATCIRAHQFRREREVSLAAAKRSERALDGLALALRKSFHDISKCALNVQAPLTRLERRNATAEEQEIIRSCRKAGRTLKHILQRARDVGKRLAKPKRDWCQIETLLHEALGKHLKEAKKANVHIDCIPRDTRAWVNASQIMEAFENVIENAIEAMPAGGRLTACLRVAGEQCEVLFSDTGKGMEQCDIDLLMGQFTDESRSAGGIGMGLFLTRLDL